MNYFKNYKKKKKKSILFKILICVIIVYFIYEIFNIDWIKGDDLNENVSIETIIEHSSSNIVGISKEYQSSEGTKSTWGSGIIISKNGYILTNEHLCGMAGDFVSVVIDYNKSLRANVIWSNSDLDLAIIKVDCKFNNCAILGDSSSIKIGQQVYTIGNPISMSFNKSVSNGIISGLNRNLEFEENGRKFYLNNLIQTDAVINLGNSGGALINEKGEVIGINTIKISSAELMGFAVPINIVKPIIYRLEKDGMFKEITLNIWCYDKYSINEVNLPVNLDEGIYIAQVNANSNAEKAGLKVGDIILTIDGNQINSVADFKAYIYSKNSNDNIILKIKRDKSTFFININLEEK